MLYLITGLPGNAKTLHAIQRVKAQSEKENRPVYYNRIKELTLPWQEWDVERWEELPPNAIFVIDEAQFKFPVRGRGEPPPYINNLAVHRHSGVDFYLITQDPMLIDSFVRRLCGVHYHLVRNFGFERSTVHEFPTGVKHDVSTNRKGSIRHEWAFPKELYGVYKSADAHTYKGKLPMRVWIMGIAALVFLGGAVGVYVRMSARVTGPVPGQPGGAVANDGPRRAGPGGGSPGVVMSPVEFAAAHMPRVDGLAYTAPIYDKVTAPTAAPYPAACVESKTRCQCYTDQATRLDMPADLCKQIAQGGFFLAWAKPGAAGPAQQTGRLVAEAPPVPGGPISLGPARQSLTLGGTGSGADAPNNRAMRAGAS